MGTSEPLRHRNRRGNADWALRAVLVAMESAFRATQGVVLDNYAEVWGAIVSAEASDEGGGQVGDADGYVEVMLLQIVHQNANRALLLEADLRMARDVVSHGE